MDELAPRVAEHQEALDAALTALGRIDGDLDVAAAIALLESVVGRLRAVADGLEGVAAASRVPDIGRATLGERRRHDLGEVCREAAGDLMAWDRERLRLQVEPTEVWAPRHLLRGLFGGLLRSALERTPEGPVRVGVAAVAEAGGVVLAVTDDGTPVGDARAADPDWLVRAPVDDVTPASLGLAAASSAARVLGGRLEVVDAGGHGTRVRVELPQRQLVERTS